MSTAIRRLVLLLVMCCLPVVAWAEVIVLVQGYLGKGDGWRDSGISAQLQAGGWTNGGHFTAMRRAPGSANVAIGSGGSRFYTVALPTEAPMLFQLRVLEPYLAAIRERHPGESLILVGHSAGGVLARLYLVRNPGQPVAALVTIASPHLGTETAELGAMIGQSPLGWFAPLLGGQTFSRSQGLFLDLVRERPQSFLYWLNRQEHPASRYVSVMRTENSTLGGDLVVPVWSQDMNNVYALRGRSSSVKSSGGHGLQKQDGGLLLRILRQLRSL